MSHVADALRRAQRDAERVDAFRDDDHPWAGQLPVIEMPEPPPLWPPAPAARIRHVDERPAAARAFDVQRASRPAAEREPGDSPRHVSFADPAVRQQITGLVDRLFLQPDTAPRSVAFAGLEAGPRTGWVAALVADNLAERTSAKVGIVDLNFESPSLHEWFAVPLTPGVAEGVADDTLAASARKLRGNLWLVPAGARNPGELSAAVLTSLSNVTDPFDHIILSLEPLTGRTGGIVSTFVDGIVLTISADTTRRETGRSAVERLQSAGVTVLGAVLTDRRFPIPNAIYRRL
jgi:Mrp family chromosome partitioning ATPase